MSAHFALPAGDRGPPPDHADLLIIGGGIMGLAVAYNAARLGQRNIVVVDRSYLCSGASGRNGGGVRMQWSTADNVRLMQSSVEICKRFAADMGINVWFRQGGYLFLCRDARYLGPLEQNVKVQNECGVPTRLLDPLACMRMHHLKLSCPAPPATSAAGWPRGWSNAGIAGDAWLAVRPSYGRAHGLPTSASRSSWAMRPMRKGSPPP